MKQKNPSQRKNLLDRITHQDERTLKEKLFTTLSYYMEGRGELPDIIFYIAHILETLSLFWFSLTPTLAIFDPSTYLLEYFVTGTCSIKHSFKNSQFLRIHGRRSEL